MSKRGGPSLHQFIMREAASTGQLKKDAIIMNRPRYDDQFRETEGEKNARLRARRIARSMHDDQSDHVWEPGAYGVCRKCGRDLNSFYPQPRW